MEPLVKLENISKSYGESEVLKNVFLEIKKEEIVGLIGETGSGKSTIAKIIAGLEKPDSGKIIFNNFEMKDLKSRKFEECAAIQYIFQDPYSSLEESMTIEQALKEPDRLCRRHGKKDIVSYEEAFRLVYFEEFRTWKDRKIGTLSGGQRQKLCIARAVIPKPKLIIADESMAMLDFESSIEINKILQELRGKLKTSMLIITHQLDVIKAICDEVKVLHNGAIIESSKIEDLIDMPKTEYVKELIACMNLFKGGSY